jgi:putative thioredoxin
METSTTTAVFDVSEVDFDTRVIERSRELPVVVDFWAEWCGPCRALGPVLEGAVAARAGKVELAKLDVDANGSLAARYRVQGIPAVKAFRNGEVAAEFTGAAPPTQVESFLDALVPSEAEELAAQAVAGGDEDALRHAVESDPRQAAPANALAKLLLRRGEAAAALEVVTQPANTDFISAGLAARAEMEQAGDAPVEAFQAWDEGDHERALDVLQRAVAAAPDAARRDLLRRVMVGIFTELGADDPVASRHRRRLAAALA